MIPSTPDPVPVAASRALADGADAPPHSLLDGVRQLRILWRLLVYVQPYRFRLALMMLCTIVASATKVGGVVLIKPFGDLVLGTFDVERYTSVPGLRGGVGRSMIEQFARTLEQSPYTALFLLILVLMALIAMQSFCQLAATYLQTYIGGRIAIDLKQQMLSRLLMQPIAYYQKMGRGIVHRIITMDSHAAFRTLYVLFNRMVRGPLEVAALLAIAISIDWRLTLFAAAVLPAAGFSIVAFRRRLHAFEGKMLRVQGADSGLLQEVLASPESVKAFQMEPYFQQRYAAVSKKLFRVMLALQKSRAWMGPVMDLAGGIAMVVFVYINGRALIERQVELSSFVLLYACLGALVEPVRRFGKGYGEVLMNLISLSRVFDMLERTPTIHDRADAVRLEDVRGRVEFRNVTFGYEPSMPVLHDISFTVAPGERVALVGPSGAGKTTLARLLLRFYEPQQGAVLLDGVDIQTCTMESLRRHVGLVTQQTVLFTGTVRENITAGRPDHDDGAVLSAAVAAHADEFIRQLPHGYDTFLGDHGVSLSGGQAQRLALARALYKNPSVLVLDEATSSLDSIAEEHVRDAVTRLTTGHTCIVIAHRLSTILNADRVILLHGGRVAGAGSHEALMTGNRLYQRLFEQQILWVDDDVTVADAAAPATRP